MGRSITVQHLLHLKFTIQSAIVKPRIMSTAPAMRKIFLVFYMFIYAAASDLLKNSDFESPPSDLPANSTAVELKQNQTLPGWTFEGSVQYVTASQSIVLPDNGHAILLGADGKINQTFTAGSDFVHYVLTFTLAPGGSDCPSVVGLKVSAPDSEGIFVFKQKYGKEEWESYGHYLGNWGEGEAVNLVIESQDLDSNSSSVCWPVIDNLLLKTMATLAQESGNLLVNGGFEYGPDFPINSTEGILLDSSPNQIFSPLRQWAIVGTVKYIDSKHFFVPKGDAAVEIVGGDSNGVETGVTLTEGSSYDLQFMAGDANDSCVGNLVIGAQAASTFKNFTLVSNGTGSAQRFSLPFKADQTSISIRFLSYETIQTEGGIFCGPVIDDVVLRASQGSKMEVMWKILISLFLITCF